MKPDGHTESTLKRDQTEAPEHQTSFAPLALDYEKYQPYLSDLDITDEQARELLQTLFNIMSAFVDMGFGLDSTQTILGSMIEKAVRDSGDPLQRTDNTKLFNGAAGERNHDQDD